MQYTPSLVPTHTVSATTDAMQRGIKSMISQRRLHCRLYCHPLLRAIASA